MKKQLVALAIAFSFVGAAQAADLGVSAVLGTTGAGFHLSVPIHKQINARFGVNALHYSYDGSTSDVDYRIKLKMETFDALVDWFPMDGAFRVTTGVVYNGNKTTATGKPTAGGTYTINGNTYTASDVGSLDAKIDFRNIAPYLGIGWGKGSGAEKAGFGFTADLGAMFQGSPRTSLRNTGCTASAAVCDQLASDVAAENERVKDEAKDFKIYPVVRVGVNYRF